MPALASLKRQLTTELKAGERGSSRGARRLYSVLVGAELALACGLLVGSALLVRTVQRMTETPTGVDAADVATTRIQVRPAPGPQATVIARWAAMATQHTAILDAVRREPGVQAAGAANFLPFEVGWREPFLIVGDPPPSRREDAPQAQLHSVSDGYFAAMGARIVRGRDFTAFDGPDAPGAIVVNETFARRHLANREPVGTTLTNLASGIGPLGVNLKWVSGQHGVPVEIVGVVADIRNVALGQDVEPAIYFTTRQFPFSEVVIAVRAADAGAGAAAVRNALRKVAPAVPMAEPRSWGSRLAERTAEARVLRSVLLLFGGLAALLAAVGVYGLFSWAVQMRTRELAIRLALGATAGTVGGLVVRHGAEPGRRRAGRRPGRRPAARWAAVAGALRRVGARRGGHRRGLCRADRGGAGGHGATGAAGDARQSGRWAAGRVDLRGESGDRVIGCRFARSSDHQIKRSSDCGLPESIYQQPAFPRRSRAAVAA